MYKLIYDSSFKDLNENTIKIEIFKDTEDATTSSELLCTAEAIEINYETNDDVFKPLKCSDCQINVLTTKVLTDLYTALNNQIYCTIYKNGKLIWYGFGVPCLYQTDYSDEYNSLALQFNDILSSAENYKYTYIDKKQSIVSFYQIIKSIIGKIDTNNLIKNIYVHNTKKVNDSTELLNNLHILDRNFFDEANEAENCKDILSYIARYMNMTCYYFADSLYFVDYTNIHLINQYTKYNLLNDTNTITTINNDVINVNQNIYESNASIAINEQYNKIVVIANSNSNNTVTPEFNDSDDLINQNSDPNKFYETNRTISDKNYTFLNAFFKSKNDWNWQKPYSLASGTIEEVTIDNVAGANGSFWQKSAYYETEPEPSSLNWKTYFSICDNSIMGIKGVSGLQLSLKNPPVIAVKGGVFIVDIRYRLSGDWNAAECITTSDEQYYDGKYSTGFDNTMFKCRFSIADEIYFDGDNWVSYTEYHNKVARDYYKECTGPNTFRGATWYKYLDEYGYWRFCNKAEYDASNREKYTGGYSDVNAVYYYMRNGERIFIEKWFYDECALQDCFYLVHKNKTGDKVFDTTYTLTNTVSWRMNLAESEDGVAIALPNNKLTLGELKFEIFAPNQLGTIPMRRTDKQPVRCNAFHIEDVKLKYTTSSYLEDIFNDEKYEDDIKYENVIDENIVNEYDDIEFRVNTWNEHAASYSYVLTKKGDNYDFVNTMIDVASTDEYKAEEFCINNYVNYYSKPRFKYSNSIKNKNITLNSMFRENTLNKRFAINSIVYDLINDKVDVELNEIE
ncbi:hypothetical protein [Bacteroides finegoldii]|uniref:hypothetical protein n=1 Tax=Bacteroides finegoldii TaxID=338188 RepID=UPI001E41CCB8|nr:hypothetical protein [Bacteroides finegoldii]